MKRVHRYNIMTARKPTVLLTNDDGIRAPGLKHLWNSLKDHCDIYIFAPATEQSGVGAAVSLRALCMSQNFPGKIKLLPGKLQEHLQIASVWAQALFYKNL